jgi:hypothetical protein
MSAPPPKAIIEAFTFGLGVCVMPIQAPITSESAERSPQPAATIKFKPPFTGSRTKVVFNKDVAPISGRNRVQNRDATLAIR